MNTKDMQRIPYLHIPVLRWWKNIWTWLGSCSTPLSTGLAIQPYAVPHSSISSILPCLALDTALTQLILSASFTVGVVFALETGNKVSASLVIGVNILSLIPCTLFCQTQLGLLWMFRDMCDFFASIVGHPFKTYNKYLLPLNCSNC